MYLLITIDKFKHLRYNISIVIILWEETTMFTTTFRAITLAMIATILLAAPTAATQRVPGNNGTLKVHEQGTQ